MGATAIRILSNGASRCDVPPSTPQAGSLTRRRGKKSLLIRRDATLKILGALHLALFEQPGKDDFFSNLLDSGEDHQPIKRDKRETLLTKKAEPI
jgi:hypothetical protein